MQSMNTLFALQAATLKARAATGDKHIGTQIARGLVDVVRAAPPASKRGAYVVTVLQGGLTPAQAVACLEAMQ